MSQDYVDQLFTQIEKQRSKYEELLKSESAPQRGSGEGFQMALDWATSKIKSLGGALEMCEIKPGVPPVIQANLGKARDKKTVFIYGHLGIPPKEGKHELFGCGLQDCKGALLSLFTAVELYKNVVGDVPINLKFLLEALCRKHGKDFIEHLYKSRGSLFSDVDYICVLDSRFNQWYGCKPTLTWGLRGFCEFEATVESASHNLSSGDYSGALQEAMTDQIKLLNSIVNCKGDILIPGIDQEVDPVTAQEEKDYHKASFDIGKLKSSAGANTLLHKEDKKRVLMHLTRFPSISIESIERNPSQCEDSIPSHVTSKFQVKMVNQQTDSFVQECVIDHLNRTMASLNTSNMLTVKMTKSTPPWTVKPSDPNIQACKRALQRAYKQEPELIREGASIPIVYEIQEKSGKNVLLFPIGRTVPTGPRNDLNIFLYTIKTICAYIHEISR